MKKRLVLVGFALLAVLILGVLSTRMAASRAAAQIASAFPGNSQAIFENSDRFTLFQIDGSYEPPPAPEEGQPVRSEEKDDREQFHDYPVNGKTELKDAATRQKIIDASYQGLAFNGEPAACFQPHHGIRAEKNGETVDLLICFGCQQGWTYYKDQKASFLIGREPQETFDEIFLLASVKR